MKLDEITNLTEPQAVKHYIEIGKEYRSIEEKIVTSFMLAFGSLLLSIIAIAIIYTHRE